MWVSVWQEEKGVAEMICIGVHGDAELLEIHLTLILSLSFFLKDVCRCLSVCMSSVYGCLWKPEEGVGSP